MNTPKITVIMPFYNCEKFLDRALSSILTQSFGDFEIVLINDSSADGSDSIARRLTYDERIRYFVNKDRVGITKNLNFGLSVAKGDMVARMDGDDISEKNRLEKQYNFLKNNPKISLVGSWAKALDENGNFLRNIVVPVSNGEIRRSIIIANPFVHSSVLFRKKDIIAVGRYRESTKRGQDYDLWLRLVFSGYQTANIPEYLVKYTNRDLINEGDVAEYKAIFSNKIALVKQYKIHLLPWQKVLLYFGYVNNVFFPRKISRIFVLTINFNLLIFYKCQRFWRRYFPKSNL